MGRFDGHDSAPYSGSHLKGQQLPKGISSHSNNTKPVATFEASSSLSSELALWLVSQSKLQDQAPNQGQYMMPFVGGATKVKGKEHGHRDG